MNKQNLAYITNLKIEDVPWSRLTTTYGRASEFPEIFKQLSAAISEKNLTQSLTTSKSNSGQNTANPANNNEAKFNAKAACDVLDKIFKEIEHQSTFWHATPFALVFLVRIFMRAKLVADNGSKNEVAELIASRLGEFLAFMLIVCSDADKINHAAPLGSFADMLAEKYLWSQSDENDEELWEERFYDDDLFYSFYFYSRTVLDATGVDFKQFKPIE